MKEKSLEFFFFVKYKKCFILRQNLCHLIEFHVNYFVNQNVDSLNLKNPLFPPTNINIVYLLGVTVTLFS